MVVAVLMLRNDREKLMKTGTETVGIITHTYTLNGRFNDPYVINFSFIKDDTILNGVTSLTLGEKELFFEAVVGQTYKVRYNPNKPQKKSRIYPDEPVVVSNEDYERLLDRVYKRQKRVEKSKTWWKNF